MSLITLEEYKTFHNLRKPDDDGKIQFLIDSVSALIKAYIGRDLTGNYEEHTQVISLDYETDVVYLDHYPINSIVSIFEPARYTTDSTIHVPLYHGSGYIVNKAQGTLTRLRGSTGFARWPISPSYVSITYTLGGDQGSNLPVPTDLKLAAIELVDYYKNEQFRQSRTVMGRTEVNTPAKGDSFPQHIQIILDRYK